MSFFVAAGISCGVLAGIWAQFSGTFGQLTWIGFISWACFYAAGGKVEGMKKTLAANLSGVFWAFAIMVIMGLLPNFTFALGVAVIIGAFAMCAQAHISFLGFIPGSFAGCAAAFGNALDYKVTIISLVCGAVLGYISEVIAVWIHKVSAKKAVEERPAAE